MGFFLDGDDAQLPVILGIFANTGYYASDEEYKSPFVPFTGYTSKIKPNSEFISKNEGGDDSNKSQKSPRFLPQEIVEDLKEQQEKGKRSFTGKPAREGNNNKNEYGDYGKTCRRREQ